MTLSWEQLGDLQDTIEEFHKAWWDFPNHQPYSTWDGVFWRGYKVVKNPNDLLNYAMLIHALQPKYIIETGTAHGGSALFFWDIGKCNVISIDNQSFNPAWPSQNPRIMFWHSIDSTDPIISTYLAQEFSKAGRPLPILVSLDSDHHYQHVLDELNFYSRYATYIVVEDTNLNGHPVDPQHGPGPWEAVQEWLPRNPEWEEDTRMRERFLFSANTWLRRK